MSRTGQVTAVTAAVVAAGFALTYVTVMVDPVLGVGAGVLLFLSPLWLRIRVLAATAVLAMLFANSAADVVQVPALGNADEGLVIVFCLAAIGWRLWQHGQVRGLAGLLPLSLYVLWTGISAVINDVPVTTSTTAAFILLKGWLLAIGLAQLDWTAEDVRRTTRFAVWVVVACITGIAANLALGARWIALWNGASYFTYRFGLPSQQGLFEAPLIAGNVMACAALLVLTHGWVFGTRTGHLLLLAGTALGSFLSGRRTAVAGLAVGGVAAGLRQRPASTGVQLLLVGPVVLFASWSVILEASRTAYGDYVERGTRAARSILHRDMFDVANQHFPFGAGFGRFGSAVAGQDYSPEYVERGYRAVWGLSDATGNATYLSDTQWPAVIGEGGYIGAAFAVLALLALARLLWRASRADDPIARWLGLGGFAVFLVLAVASVGMPVFFGGAPPQVLLYGPAGVLVGYLATRQAADQDQVTTSASGAQPSRFP